MLEDATGAVAIEFQDAKVEGEQVHRGSQSAGIGQALLASAVGAGTLGHRYTEWIVAAGVPVYVLARSPPRRPSGSDPAKRYPFLISIKSEEEREKSLGRTPLWQMVGMIVFAIAALVLLYIAFTSGPVQMAPATF